ncbi:MAG: CPBP family intramembrane metalloprotease [Anaerolineales bacterium]|jgi:membrane protease YdiL (CAAX protease family)
MSQIKNTGQFEWMKRVAYDRPVIFSILVILVAGLLTEIPFNIFFESLVEDPGAEFIKVIIGHVLTGLILVWLLVKLDLFKKAGFTPPSQWKAVWLVWPLAILALLNLSSLFDGSLVIDTSRPGSIVLYTILNLSIGFCEEVMGRGVILLVMLRKWGNKQKGIYQAVLVSSVLFGAAHLFNLIVGRLPLLPNLTQVVYSFAFGVVFAACFLRNNSIWPVIIMHAAVDFAGGLRHIAVDEGIQTAVANNTMTQVVSTLIISLPLLLYGLVILRKVTPFKKSDQANSFIVNV